MIVGGPRVMDCTCAAVTGSTVSEAVTVPFSVAVMLTLVCAGTAVVLIVNIPETAPAAIVKLEVESEATVVFALASVTTTPPEGAAEVSVTVPVEVPPGPPSTSKGERESDFAAGGGGGVCTFTALGTPEHATAAQQATATSAPRQVFCASLHFRAGKVGLTVLGCRFGIDLLEMCPQSRPVSTHAPFTVRGF